MAAMQSFKIFFEDLEDEVRRFSVERDGGQMYELLCEKIEAVLGKDTYRFTWKDQDDDTIHCASEEELLECVNEATSRTSRKASTNPVISLFVRSVGKVLPHGENKFEKICCDGCEKDIFGTCYKCLVCKDFDLCPTCEAQGKHGQHTMLAVREDRDLQDILAQITPQLRRWGNPEPSSSSTRKTASSPVKKTPARQPAAREPSTAGSFNGYRLPKRSYKEATQSEDDEELHRMLHGQVKLEEPNGFRPSERNRSRAVARKSVRQQRRRSGSHSTTESEKSEASEYDGMLSRPRRRSGGGRFSKGPHSEENDTDFVMNETGTTRRQAEGALKRHKGDVVKAVKDLRCGRNAIKKSLD